MRNRRAVRAKPAASHPPASVIVAGVKLTHPERVLFPEEGLTKRDLASYYEAVAKWILPHIAGRPLSIVRCPAGRTGPCFFQKHLNQGLPKAIRRVHIADKHAHSSYIVIEDLAGLIGLAQLGAIEMHPWGSRADRPERPDRMVFDFDPGPEAPWSSVVAGAKALYHRLEELGLRSYLKTSGGKGLHVIVPIERRSTWAEVKALAATIAGSISEADPGHYVTTASKARRIGRVYIDYLRNTRGATTVASYSARARAGATVSTPLSWDELSDRLDPHAYSIRTTPQRLAAQTSDPWSEFFRVRQSITAEIMRRVTA